MPSEKSRLSGSVRKPFLFTSILILLAWPCPLLGDEGEIPFKLIDGRLCARCTLQGPSRSIPANVVIDLGSPHPLLIHERTAARLGAMRDMRAALLFRDAALTDLEARAADLPFLESLTREHAFALEEIPALAVLGLPAFGEQRIQLEAGEGKLLLLPSSEPLEMGRGISLWEMEGGYWIEGKGSRNESLRVQFATSVLDTLVDRDRRGAEILKIGSLDVTEYEVLRPEALPKGVDALLGTRLLSHFRLILDPVRRRLYLEPVRKPSPPLEEKAYFQARADKDEAALALFLESHPESRLAREGSELLLRLRLSREPADPESIEEALLMLCRSSPKERRASVMIELAEEWAEQNRSDRLDLMGLALKLGLEEAPADRDALAASKIHGRMGWVALRQDDLREARRRLLSAAFGMPRDGMVNLWMGELYERMNKKARAWSRYAQALISDEAPREAWSGLDRLNRDAAFRKSFTMRDGERLLEGRIPDFHPPDRFEDGAGGFAGEPVGLIELFTCADHPDTAAPQMAFKGLSEFFGPTRVAMITYHLPRPKPDPLASRIASARASFYRVADPPALFFDGLGPFEEGGGPSEADALYSFFKTFCFRAGASPKPYRIECGLSLEGDRLQGPVTVEGAADDSSLRLFALLCEKRVMLPCANGLLFHRYVARRALSPPDGFPLSGGNRTFSLSAGAESIIASLEKGIADLEDEWGVEFHMRPAYVDIRECMIVVFVQDVSTNEVMAARVFEVRE